MTHSGVQEMEQIYEGLRAGGTAKEEHQVLGLNTLLYKRFKKLSESVGFVTDKVPASETTEGVSQLDLAAPLLFGAFLWQAAQTQQTLPSIPELESICTGVEGMLTDTMYESLSWMCRPF